MRDISGIELQIGDLIAATNIGYADLRRVFIVGFTPKKIRVDTKSSLDHGVYDPVIETRFPYQVSFISRK